MHDAHDAESDAFARSDHVESGWAVVDLETIHGDVVLRGLGRVDQIAIRATGDRCQVPGVGFSFCCRFGFASFLCFGGDCGSFSRVCLTLCGIGGSFRPIGLCSGFVAFGFGFSGRQPRQNAKDQ